MISWNSDFFDDSLTSLETKSAAFWREEDGRRKEVSLGSKKGVINERQSNRWCFNSRRAQFCSRRVSETEREKEILLLRDKISYLTNETVVVVVRADWFYPRPSPATSLPIFGNSIRFIDAQMWQRVRWIWSSSKLSPALISTWPHESALL